MDGSTQSTAMLCRLPTTARTAVRTTTTTMMRRRRTTTTSSSSFYTLSSIPRATAFKLLLLLLFWCMVFLGGGGQGPFVSAVRHLQIASPLQSLTIWDPEIQQVVEQQQQLTGSSTTGSISSMAASSSSISFRSRFLPKFRTGLQAEVAARKALQEKDNIHSNDFGKGDSKQQTTKNKAQTNLDWAGQVAMADRQRQLAKEKIVEKAYDEAVAPLADLDAVLMRQLQQQRQRNRNKFQFVGVINSHTNSIERKPPITWYARPKPASAQWSVRLVHVNRDAILKDLFNRGKIDIFGRYENTGQRDEKTNQPIVACKYIVRERSWKNLWNFSLKHVITDSSGMYWRERRLRPGLYTDGQTVYEASYRYRDGRNGMHKLSSFPEFLNSRSIHSNTKEKIQKRLSDDTPDIVLED